MGGGTKGKYFISLYISRRASLIMMGLRDACIVGENLAGY